MLKFQYDCDYTLEFDDPSNSVDLCSVIWFQGTAIYVKSKVGINRVVVTLIPEFLHCRHIEGCFYLPILIYGDILGMIKLIEVVVYP